MSSWSASRSIYPATLVPSSNDALDIGSSSLSWRTIYVGTSIIGTGGANALSIRPNTSDASDNSAVRINGGGGDGSNGSRGANVVVYGNESIGNGALLLDAGGVPGGNVELRTFTAGGTIHFSTAINTLAWSITNGGQLRNRIAANELTGAGSALLGSNCPAVDATAPWKWFKLADQAGSNVYIPVWK